MTLGGVAIFSAGADAFAHRPGGWQGVGVGLVLLAAGISAGTWAVRSSTRATAHDRHELREAGLDDGLPMGAYMQGQQIGLEAADLWLVWGTLAMGVGLLFGVAGVTDPQVGWKFGLAFSSVGFVPAALCFRAGTGTKYWLTSDGIETCRWLRRSVRWADAERIVLVKQGIPTQNASRMDAIELQTSKPVRGTPRWWPGTDLSIKAVLVEVGRHDLLAMIRERVELARAAR